MLAWSVPGAMMLVMRVSSGQLRSEKRPGAVASFRVPQVDGAMARPGQNRLP